MGGLPIVLDVIGIYEYMAARSSNYSISVFRYIVKSTGIGNAWNCGAGHLDEDNMQIICVAHWNAELVLPGWLMR